jgi:uncharacterized protein YndB with AHSA1/START domain
VTAPATRYRENAEHELSTVHHLLDIAAPPEVVFRSLTTAEGLSAWWTTEVTAGEPMVGADLSFTFRGPFNPQMRIVELDRPACVTWKGTGGHDAWGKTTTIRFQLDPADGGTVVRFWHELSPDTAPDTLANVNFNWGYYLDSLRLACETGTGKPFQPKVAGARVGASGLA